MRYRFVFGIGRSGTTLLGRLLALTSSSTRFVSELCPGIADRIPSPVFMVEPRDVVTATRVRDAIVELSAGKSPFSEDHAYRIERNDPNAEILLVKDIHSLLAYREIVSGLEDWRAVVILRETSRTLDSYFFGNSPKDRCYLVQEYKFIANYLTGGSNDTLMDRALGRLRPAVAKYYRRPHMFTTELFRQAAATEFICQFLEIWASEDDRVTRIRFEDLCRDPLAETLRLLDFLELEYEDETLVEIQSMTSGNSGGYYATDKNTRSILRQPYKYLGYRELNRLRTFLGHA
ncbi:MAG: sulfotransferase domain-containing protein [Myxococcales bacterium]|nr:sulfotransferase domain-containing protein [Myxococcales bacterium]